MPTTKAKKISSEFNSCDDSYLEFCNNYHSLQEVMSIGLKSCKIFSYQLNNQLTNVNNIRFLYLAIFNKLKLFFLHNIFELSQGLKKHPWLAYSKLIV